MPVELQKLIKEYAMPIYKRTLHFKAIDNYEYYFPLCKYKLKSTPYTLLKQKLSNTFYITDLFRAYYNEINTIYASYSITISHDISLTNVIVLE
jgi:hypothetical protein